MTDLASELTDLFKAGLQARPDMREGLVAALSASLQDQQGTMTKEEANYRDAEDPNQSCGHCSNFHGDKCDIVAGRIASHFTCDHFEPADSTGDPAQDKPAEKVAV